MHGRGLREDKLKFLQVGLQPSQVLAPCYSLLKQQQELNHMASISSVALFLTGKEGFFS